MTQLQLLLLRLTAGEDLVHGIEAAARAHGIRSARIHAGPGSLMHANLRTAAATAHAPGPGTEILVLQGELLDGQATLHGAVADPEGRVYAGHFLPGQNPICITLELALERLD